MKKAFITITLISIIFCGVGLVSAATLGTLSYWESDSNEIGRWGKSLVPSIWVGVADNNMSTSDFSNYINHAQNQWSNAGIKTQGIDEISQAQIVIRAGSYSTLKSIESALAPTDGGLTTYSSNNILEGTWKYNSAEKTGYKLRGQAKVYIVVKSGRTASQYENITTHELGHALGWLGHSSKTSDVMYGNVSSNTTLTTRDKRHLNQIY